MWGDYSFLKWVSSVEQCSNLPAILLDFLISLIHSIADELNYMKRKDMADYEITNYVSSHLNLKQGCRYKDINMKDDVRFSFFSFK